MNTTLICQVDGTTQRYAQLTATEQPVGRGEQPENGLEHTITESYPTCSDKMPAWLSDVWEQLRVIASLPDGWDSYGAASPNTNWLIAGWGLLLCLCNKTNLPKPHVNPTRNGGVQFEWESGERYFELEIVAERAATYLYCDDAAHVEETGNIFEEEDLGPMQAFVRKVEAIQ